MSCLAGLDCKAGLQGKKRHLNARKGSVGTRQRFEGQKEKGKRKAVLGKGTGPDSKAGPDTKKRIKDPVS